jgi:hypothetical protein
MNLQRSATECPSACYFICCLHNLLNVLVQIANEMGLQGGRKPSGAQYASLCSLCLVLDLLCSLCIQLCSFRYKYYCPSQSVTVTLRLTVSQSVRLGVEPTLGLLTRVCFFKRGLKSKSSQSYLAANELVTLVTSGHAPHRKYISSVAVPLLASRQLVLPGDRCSTIV